MSLGEVYQAARACLGVSPAATAHDLKRAYRRLMVEHSPDRDPEGFRAVRDAYDLLRQPVKSALRLLLEPVPSVPAPSLDLPSVERGPTALAILRLAAGELDAAALLGAEEAGP